MEITTALLLLLGGGAVAQGLSLGLSAGFSPRRAAPLPAGGLPPAGGEEAVFLFRDGLLIDTTPAAHQLLATAGRQGRSLGAVAALLALRFPDLPAALEADSPEHRLADPAGAGGLTLTRWAGFLRLTLAGTPTAPEAAAQPILHQELTALRAIAEDSPHPIWKEDESGRVNWANRAYLALTAKQEDGGVTLWPDTPLFADLPRPRSEGETCHGRATLAPATGPHPPAWYEVTCVRRGGQVTGFAQDASGVVASEDNRRHLLQTLTRTFAHLSAGLAVFDRDRRLVLFNPAFIDLTGLRVDFLSQRPLVQSVLDKLHDIQMLPEPRHYGSWREQLVAMEAAAVEGSYCETWMLPQGQTYRVSGRPHGDGALAFLFEDISDEAALSRQIRAEQEAVQAVLDRLPHPLAAFSRAGVMILRNAAYDRLWAGPTPPPPRAGLITAQLPHELARWRRASRPHDDWQALARTLASGEGSEAPQDFTAQTLAGEHLRIRTTRLAGGVRQVEFLPAPPPAPSPAMPARRGTRARQAAIGGE